jgi:hypothetical protein
MSGSRAAPTVEAMLTDPTARRLIAEARVEELRRSAHRIDRERTAAKAETSRATRAWAAPRPVARELRWLRWLRAR